MLSVLFFGNNIFLLIYILLFFLAILKIGRFIRYHVIVNDFWGNMYISSRLNKRDPRSFYNGFFPIGYSLLLRLFSTKYPFVGQFFMNSLFASILLTSITALALSTTGAAWSIACLILVSLNYKIFHYMITIGPDIGQVAFSVTAFVLTVSTVLLSSSVNPYMLIVCGMLFGLSALWRYHSQAIALGVCTAILSLKKEGSLPVFFIAGFFSVYFIQVTVNILSGRRPFETSQSFNVFKMVNGMDWWFHIESVKIPASVFKVILTYPKKFLYKYTGSVFSYLYLLLPSVFTIFLTKDPLMSDISFFTAISFAVFIPAVSLGGGDRAELTILPIFLYQSVCLMKLLFNELPMLKSIGYILIFPSLPIIIYLIYNIYYIIHLLKYICKIDRHYRRVEGLLKEEGIKSSLQVYSTDLDFYLPSLAPYYPYNKHGCWVRYDLYGYNREFPEISRESLDSFLDNCLVQGIKCLVLSGNASSVYEGLDRVYRGEIGSERIRKCGEVGGFKVYIISR